MVYKHGKGLKGTKKQNKLTVSSLRNSLRLIQPPWQGNDITDAVQTQC